MVFFLSCFFVISIGTFPDFQGYTVNLGVFH